MEEQFKTALNFIKENINVNGCITGSAMLGYFEGSDIDIFCYDEVAFTDVLYRLYFNKMFLILDPLDKWKFNNWTTDPNRYYLKKNPEMPITIKLMYNMCIPINIVYRVGKNNIFSVISDFDLDIIAKGFDLKTKEVINLSENLPNKQATWNRWNKSFTNVSNIWKVGRVLRQFDRCIKYYKRGYNTDLVTLKYIELLENAINYENIFNSEKVDLKIEEVTKNAKILIKILKIWLENHSITEEELEIIKETIKKI